MTSTQTRAQLRADIEAVEVAAWLAGLRPGWPEARRLSRLRRTPGCPHAGRLHEVITRAVRLGLVEAVRTSARPGAVLLYRTPKEVAKR